MRDLFNKQTAYQYNSAPASNRLNVCDHGWSMPINQMIEQRYAFLKLQYDGTGYLFRGMSQGLYEALLKNCFWHFLADGSVGKLEQELDVMFSSQDISDALSVSRLWQDPVDAGILVFQSKLFNAALEQKQAAMMATAEPGVVFKYPLLTSPLVLDDIASLIVTPDFVESVNEYASSSNERTALRDIVDELVANDKLIILNLSLDDLNLRQQIEQAILLEFERRGIYPAQACSAPFKPESLTS